MTKESEGTAGRHCPDEIVFPFSPRRLIGIIVGASIVVAFGALALVGSFWARQSDPAVGLLLGSTTILFFGPCLRWACLKLNGAAPALRVASDGLYDDSSAIAPGFVAWEDIESIHRSTAYPCYLCIVPEDVEELLRRQPTWKRWVMRMNARMVGAPITIGASLLDASLDEVEKAITDRLDANG